MFAAGRGISSRIVGTKPKREGEKVEPKKRSNLTLRQRLYVPCMWSSSLSCCCGFIIMFGGMAMSFMGFYAEFFATSIKTVTTNNVTEQQIAIDTTLQFHIANFRYLGPIFMGLGTFLGIVACVIVLETRDKVLEMMEEHQWKAYKKKKKPNFYDLIVLEMKKKGIDEYRGTNKYHFDSGGQVEDGDII